MSSSPKLLSLLFSPSSPRPSPVTSAAEHGSATLDVSSSLSKTTRLFAGLLPTPSSTPKKRRVGEDAGGDRTALSLRLHSRDFLPPPTSPATATTKPYPGRLRRDRSPRRGHLRPRASPSPASGSPI
ncbi:uncharacterized protein A4U43_C01F32630 [Asparagus officinalis]|uniref:Uncharacterized protein n=1 Tax=Asparagus officinalis TaxID=4686 RepID=A0A5P1FVJ0_ASPOF|nr:uncharacterized protein A4U43_C01F32630 [Asparagus officinalis]